MNYLKLIRKILDTALAQTGVNMVGEGDIYSINNMQKSNYPIVWVASTAPHVEKINYTTYNLTLYYIDREMSDTDRQYSPDTSGISNAGIQVLSNIIKKLRDDYEILNIPDEISYTVWTDTQIFSDKCAGVYTQVAIMVENDSTCATV